MRKQSADRLFVVCSLWFSGQATCVGTCVNPFHSVPVLPLGSVDCSLETTPVFSALLQITRVVGGSLSFKFNGPFTPSTVHHGVGGAARISSTSACVVRIEAGRFPANLAVQ